MVQPGLGTRQLPAVPPRLTGCPPAAAPTDGHPVGQAPQPLTPPSRAPPGAATSAVGWTFTTSRPGRWQIVTCGAVLAPACLATLASASETTKYVVALISGRETGFVGHRGVIVVATSERLRARALDRPGQVTSVSTARDGCRGPARAARSAPPGLSLSASTRSAIPAPASRRRLVGGPSPGPGSRSPAASCAPSCRSRFQSAPLGVPASTIRVRDARTCSSRAWTWPATGRAPVAMLAAAAVSLTQTAFERQPIVVDQDGLVRARHPRHHPPGTGPVHVDGLARGISDSRAQSDRRNASCNVESPSARASARAGASGRRGAPGSRSTIAVPSAPPAVRARTVLDHEQKPRLPAHLPAPASPKLTRLERAG